MQCSQKRVAPPGLMTVRSAKYGGAAGCRGLLCATVHTLSGGGQSSHRPLCYNRFGTVRPCVRRVETWSSDTRRRRRRRRSTTPPDSSSKHDRLPPLQRHGTAMCTPPDSSSCRGMVRPCAHHQTAAAAEAAPRRANGRRLAAWAVASGGGDGAGQLLDNNNSNSNSNNRSIENPQLIVLEEERGEERGDERDGRRHGLQKGAQGRALC